jgi:hypothetical protein
MRCSPCGFRSLAALFVLALGCTAARANDIYIAQTAAGGNTGADCADAYAYPFFNTSGNWGTGANQIGPGTTVHLCGTFTDSTPGDTLLYFYGSGSSGSPITLYFESGASLTNTAYWGSNTGGAIDVAYNGAKSYIVIDGGTNGLIQNTGNGTGLAYEHNSTGVYVSGSNITVKNLTIANICVHLTGQDNNGCTTSGSFDQGISVNGGTNNSVLNNAIHDTATGVYLQPPSGATGDLISGNTIYHANWGIGVGVTSGIASGVTISGNTIYDSYVWDTPGDTYHHNGIMVYDSATGGYSGTVINNNYIYGNLSQCSPNSCATAMIFLDDNTGFISGTVGYNNVLINGPTSVGPGDAYITGNGGNSTGSSQWYNNTIYGAGASVGFGGSYATFENNVVAGVRQFVNGVSSSVTIDYNAYMTYTPTGCTPWVWNNGTCSGQSTLAAWQAACSCDAHSTYNAATTISAVGVPQSGSPVVQAGANLTSLGITALDSDKSGVPRPSAGPWGIGAYQSSGGTVAPTPPAGLTTAVH